MAKTEGQQVREAYDGPDVDHDELLGKVEQFNREDAQRASSAGESRNRIKLFTEQSGFNPKALSVLRSLVKVGEVNQDKAMDQIRSLEIGLPMIKDHIAGQGTGEMEFGEDDDASEEPEATEEAATAEADSASEEADPETEEFNAAVDEAVGEGNTTPIDFGGAA